MPWRRGLAATLILIGVTAGAWGAPKAKKHPATLKRVSVTFETIKGQRAPDAQMRVDVNYSEFTFASNYEQPPLAPGITFTAGSPVVVDVPLDYGISHGMTPCPKDFVLRALREKDDPVGLYVELAKPQTWSFNAKVLFEYSDGTSYRGEAHGCDITPEIRLRQCPVREEK
jgi:hypothetical protein